MGELEPTPERIAAARRAASREWTVEHDENAYATCGPAMTDLINAGLALLYMPPTRLRLDYWTLTPRGFEWLARAERDLKS
ncbi:hypothetical protein [Actinoplanes sp. URMC 104]|uniref:hypothetical protein n=1 Tax=Actinoplanes sp. URMC 104 TaxID=3423409 RepID=UPI003F1C2B4E